MQQEAAVCSTSMSSSTRRKLTLENWQISVCICLSLTAKSPEVIRCGDHCIFISPAADNSQKTAPLEINWAVLKPSQPLPWAVLCRGFHKVSGFKTGGWN